MMRIYPHVLQLRISYIRTKCTSVAGLSVFTFCAVLPGLMVAFAELPVWGKWNFFPLSLFLTILVPGYLPFSLSKLLIQLFEFLSTGSKALFAGTPFFFLPTSACSLDSLRQLRWHILCPSRSLNLRLALVIFLFGQWLTLIFLLGLEMKKAVVN